MVEAFLEGLTQLGQPLAIAAVVAGTIIGVVFGAIPGLGSVIAMAVLLPFTFGWDAHIAMFLFAGIFGTASTGGAIPAILLNTPGTIANVCTTLDGHPMARRGEAGRALGLAAMASGLGTFFSIIVLALLLPAAKLLILAFGAPEFFWLVILGLFAVTLASRDNLVKGLAAGGVGILMSLIGLSLVFGQVRFALDSEFLYDGLPVVPLVVGFFALSELMVYTSRGGSIAKVGEGLAQPGIRQTVAGALEVFQYKRMVLRGSIIGTVLGAVPGVGGAVANFLAYTTAKQASKTPELFGTGYPGGIVASESANDAKDGGILLPTLTFGIPGNLEMVILMGAFVLHGITPGRQLLVHNLDIVWAIILGVVAAQILTTFIVVGGGGFLAKISLIPVRYLAPIVAVVSFLGVYAVRSNPWDLLLAVIAACIGYLMRRAGFPLITFVIGFVLGNTAERSFVQSLQVSEGSYAIFFSSPISILIIITILFFAGSPLIKFWYDKFTAKRKAQLSSQ